MNYKNICEAVFLERINRFEAWVEINGTRELCHVKNTGRCKELLLYRAKIYVQCSENPNRKTKYDLIAVWKGNRLINMDSQAPNQVAKEFLPVLLPDVQKIRPETVYGASRFDFYLETDREKMFVEVKGVTLEEDGVALFPDAPTERGIKHLRELCDCVRNGYRAGILFVIQFDKAKHFTPNTRTHPAFGTALAEAKAAGVEVYAVECRVTPDTLEADHLIPVCIDEIPLAY